MAKCGLLFGLGPLEFEALESFSPVALVRPPISTRRRALILSAYKRLGLDKP
jgi:hypothetical protein